MARQKTTPDSTTVRVETVGVDEIAAAVSKAVKDGMSGVSTAVGKVDQKVNRNYRAGRSESGRHLARIKRLETKVSDQDKDIDTLFKMVSAERTGVTVTRHRDRSRTDC